MGICAAHLADDGCRSQLIASRFRFVATFPGPRLRVRRSSASHGVM